MGLLPFPRAAICVVAGCPRTKRERSDGAFSRIPIWRCSTEIPRVFQGPMAEAPCTLPGVWLGLAIDLASLRGVRAPVHSVIHVLGNLRRLRSFELDLPPRRPRPLRTNAAPVRLPQSWSIPIRLPPIENPSDRLFPTPELPYLHLW